MWTNRIFLLYQIWSSKYRTPKQSRVQLSRLLLPPVLDYDVPKTSSRAAHTGVSFRGESKKWRTTAGKRWLRGSLSRLLRRIEVSTAKKKAGSPFQFSTLIWNVITQATIGGVRSVGRCDRKARVQLGSATTPSGGQSGSICRPPTERGTDR